jgi:hypothetical protein
MSLVPYETYPTPALDDVERGLLFLMALCTAGAVTMAVIESAKEEARSVLPVDAGVQTDVPRTCTDIIVRPNPPPAPPAPSSVSKPEVALPVLDAAILDVLKAAAGPLSVKDVVKHLHGSDKSDVNSRLYTMLRTKKLRKIDTGKAPMWAI